MQGIQHSGAGSQEQCSMHSASPRVALFSRPVPSCCIPHPLRCCQGHLMASLHAQSKDPILLPSPLFLFSPLHVSSLSCHSISVSHYFYPPLSPLSLLVAVVTYFTVGAFINYLHLGARGVEIIPQYTFWKDVPFLIKVSLWAYYTYM